MFSVNTYTCSFFQTTVIRNWDRECEKEEEEKVDGRKGKNEEWRKWVESWWSSKFRDEKKRKKKEKSRIQFVSLNNEPHQESKSSFPLLFPFSSTILHPSFPSCVHHQLQRVYWTSGTDQSKILLPPMRLVPSIRTLHDLHNCLHDLIFDLLSCLYLFSWKSLLTLFLLTVVWNEMRATVPSETTLIIFCLPVCLSFKLKSAVESKEPKEEFVYKGIDSDTKQSWWVGSRY